MWVSLILLIIKWLGLHCFFYPFIEVFLLHWMAYILGTVARWWLHGGYMVATWWLHGGYMVATWWLHGGYMLGTWWLHGGQNYIVVISMQY